MKKTLLVSLLIAVLICIFAITVSAEAVIPDWTETQTIPSIAFKEGFDTTSRVLLSNGDGTYTTYPTNYIIVGSDTKFSVSTELNFKSLNDATDNKYDYKYSSVVRMEIPSGYVSFEDRALRSDKGFTSMLTCKVPEGVTTFGSYMFYKNVVIIEIELPNSLTSTGLECCSNATSLKKVSIGSNTEISSQSFISCTSLENVILSEGIKTIKDKAFYKTSSLANINLPSTLTSIGDYAFFNSGLTSIAIPEKVTTLGIGIFENNYSMTKAVVKNQIIGEKMFCNTPILNTISISVSLSEIGKNGIYLNSAKATLLTFYTGSDASALVSLSTYDKITKADQISYEQYLLDVENGVTYTNSTIVYGANKCFALYNNVHSYNNETCVASCTRCNLAKVPSISEHKLDVTYTYNNGFISAGKKLTKCTIEGCTYNVEEETSAIFTLKGYSNKIGGDIMCVGYSVNTQALNDYKTKNTLKYGITAYIPGENETNISPVTSELKGITEKTIAIGIEEDYSAFDFKLTGFTSEHDGLSLVICAYVFDGENVEYLCVSDAELVQSKYATTITYNYTENE